MKNILKPIGNFLLFYFGLAIKAISRKLQYVLSCLMLVAFSGNVQAVIYDVAGVGYVNGSYLVNNSSHFTASGTRQGFRVSGIGPQVINGVSYTIQRTSSYNIAGRFGLSFSDELIVNGSLLGNSTTNSGTVQPGFGFQIGAPWSTASENFDLDSFDVYLSTAATLTLNLKFDNGTTIVETRSVSAGQWETITVNTRNLNAVEILYPSTQIGYLSRLVTLDPAVPPSAPTALTGTRGNASARIAFTAPSTGGGITNYEYSLDNGATWQASSPAQTTSPVTITGLTNGTSYPIKLRAINPYGTGTASATVTVTPATVADAPTAIQAAGGDGTGTVSFTPPASNGGAAITNYEYQLDNGAWVAVSPAATTSPITISGLTNGTTYAVKLRAVNSVGTGAESASVSFTPMGVPSAPSITQITSGNGSAIVSFSAPSSSGSSPITGYEYQLDNGAWVTAGTTSPFTISGLTNGTAYAVKVRALNSSGSGVSSAAVNVTPATVATAPTSLQATPTNGATQIAFTPPSSDGGAAITNYAYELNGSGTWIPLSPADGSTPVLVTGLTNGTTYAIKLRAINSAGEGAVSDAVNVTPATVPTAPTNLVATPKDNSAEIAFTPQSDGGAAITNYQYQIDGGAWVALSPARITSPVTIPGLTNGTPANIKIRAVNPQGVSTESLSVTVTPATTPGAPTNVQATAGNGIVDLTFTAPSSNGGSTITDYEYDLNDGTGWHSAGVTASPMRISGLTNGTAYAIKVRAKNAMGGGLASTPVNITPATTPDAPTNLRASGGNGQVEIAFDPGFNGGSAITDYEYELNGSGQWVALGDATSPVTIPGLTNGTTYGVKLRARNIMGVGAPSASVSVLPGSPAYEFERFKAQIRNTVIALSQNALGNTLRNQESSMREARERFMLDTRVSDTGFAARDNTPRGSIQGSNTQQNSAGLKGSFDQEDRFGNFRRVIRGNFETSKVGNNYSSTHISGRMAFEYRKSEDTMLGYFVGLGTGQDQVTSLFKGDQNSTALSLGGYSVVKLAKNLYFDGSFGIEGRRNKLAMKNDTLDLSSTYNTQTGIASAALTGMLELDGTAELWPQLAMTHGRTNLGNIRFTGKAYGLTDDNLNLDAGVTSLSQLTFTTELRVALDDQAVAESNSMLHIAPRWICQRRNAVVQTSDCGKGLQLRYKRTWDRASKEFNTTFGSDRVNGTETTVFGVALKMFY